MKKLIAVTVLACLAATTACSDGADVAGPVSPESSSLDAGLAWTEAVTGSAHTIGVLNGARYPRNLEFSARRDAEGAVEGRFQLHTGRVLWQGPVTCFEILNGTTVRIGGLAEKIIDPKGTVFGNSPPPQGFLEIFAIVTDNGEGSADSPDTSTPIFIGGPGTAAAGCDGTYDGTPDMELSSGNVQIHQE